MVGGPRTLYVIPARGGSKRLPGKNLQCVGGVPLVGWAVRTGRRAARRLGNPSKVVVSTDEEAIAAAARQWGAEVPYVRPAELATDTADSVAVLDHTIEWYTARGETFTEIVLLQPTSPLRTAADVIHAVETYRRGAGDSVVTVRGAERSAAPPPLTPGVKGPGLELRTGRLSQGLCPGLYSFVPSGLDVSRSSENVLEKRHPGRAREETAGADLPGGPLPYGRGSVHKAVFQTRSESAPHAGVGFNDGAVTVELNGAVYVCSPQWLRDPGGLCVPGRTLAAMMPPERSIDVDTLADLHQARSLYEEGLLWRRGRCLIIAEAGVNHNGSLATALRLADAAREAGADAVKFQTFAAERLVTRSAPKAAYQKHTTSAAESQFEMLKKLALSPEDHRKLAAHCAEQGITFLSSPFSEPDVDLLDGLDVPALKVGSGEITNHPLLIHVGATLRPVILSTGCSSLGEVLRAVEVLRGAGCAELAILHCVSSYPADPAEVNLRAMRTMAQALHLPVGYSDHTAGLEIAWAAAARGARIIEKHLTLDRGMAGPDHRASLEPAEFAQLVSGIRHIESALGDGVKRPAASEADTRTAARRSLVAVADFPAGTLLRREHLAIKRPGTGISPADLEQVLGLRLERALKADEVLTWDHLRGAGDSSCVR